ncbi:capsular polysaccharide export protein, LipB/KpsS family [Priestia megaterium]|uniref:capsular polysaccharide export protein, LipB/KpsS family n=1 Tax=Priestia megaterium TaxID=1404 RepID=UPI0028609CA2|nr:spore coat protein [Priestia megaterium]MDR7246587.1 hypothetical protein [Priestia megaterium]
MKNIYLRNYWLLYFEFVRAFENVKYNNISLALLPNFYQYLDDNLKLEMKKSTFINKLKIDDEHVDEGQIQPYFEKRLNTITVPLTPPPINGKVLFNINYLRFPKEIFTKYVNPKNSVVLAKSHEYKGIPGHSIDNYKRDVQDEIKNAILEVKQVFESYTNHPLFNNDSFQLKFISNIPLMIESLAATHRYFNLVSISCVIVGTTEDLISRILTIVAATKGIPSICLQHGLIMGEEAYLPVFSSKQAVYGEYEKQWYIKKGVNKNRIEIVGHPRFDRIFFEKKPSINLIQNIIKNNSNQKKKNILIITQPHCGSIWEELVDVLAQNESLNIIIKPHPWELREKSGLLTFYQNLESKYRSVNVVLSKGVDLYDIIQNVDMVVVKSSTVGLESLLIGKPVVTLNDDFIDYYEELGVFTKKNAKDLASLIIMYFQSKELQHEFEEKRKTFLLNNYPQKLAGEKLVDLIYKLTNVKIN